MYRASPDARCVIALAGCASILNETTHPMSHGAKTAAGVAFCGASCTLTNDCGSSVAKSGDAAWVRRASKDLDLACRHPANPDAVARAISRVNPGNPGHASHWGHRC